MYTADTYIAALEYGDRIYHVVLPDNGVVSFGSHKKDTVQIPAMSAKQIQIKCKPGAQFEITTKSPFDYNSEVQVETITVIDHDSGTAVYLQRVDVHSKKFKLPYDGVINLGRTEKGNEIQIRQKFISSKHLQFNCKNGIVEVRDLGSLNGTYLNGQRIGGGSYEHHKPGAVRTLKPGDVLSVLTTMITFDRGKLIFENVGDGLYLHEQTEPEGPEVPNPDRRYERSPRTQKTMPHEDITLAPPPVINQNSGMFGGSYSNLLGTGAMFLSSILTGIASPAMLAARTVCLVPQVINTITQGSKGKKLTRKQEEYIQRCIEVYGKYLLDQKALIDNVAEQQCMIITEENPDPRECCRIVRRLKTNLWERSPADKDFLDVRLGVGREELCVKIKTRTEQSGYQLEENVLVDSLNQLVDNSRYVDDVPARLQLRKQTTVGMIGDRQRVACLVKNMLMALTTAHCPEDVRIIGIFDESERGLWEPLRWLPHIWDAGRQTRFLVFDEVKDKVKSVSDKDEPSKTHLLCESFNDVLKERAAHLKSDAQNGVRPKPHYIFIFGAKHLVEKEDLMNRLFDNEPDMACTSLFLYNNMYSLPHGCRYIVDVDSSEPSAFARNEVNNKFYFTMDKNLPQDAFDTFARDMFSVELQGGAVVKPLPKGISFLEGYGVRKVEELNIWQRWNNANPEENLSVPIGALEGEKTLDFDISKCGPNGLVAGMPGAGKSELLTTWVMSMAVNFHPHDVQFVLLDWKHLWQNQLNPLPHVVGTLTDLDPDPYRAAISLKREIKRREALMGPYNVNKISQYRELYKKGIATENMPYLLIVADEFKEIKNEQPEFMSEFESMLTTGRALGVWLVLATQLPAGVVTEQMENKCKFRICLKMPDANNSRTMLKTPDAAQIVHPGRAYIRVGDGEVYQQFQSYFCGAPYSGDRKHASQGNPVRVLLDGGQRCKTVDDDRTVREAKTDELAAMIKHIQSVAQSHQVERMAPPWKPDLPREFALDQLETYAAAEGGWQMPWMAIPVGVYDIPEAQRQGVQYINFAASGHYGVYGSPSTGKTSLLKTVLLSLGLHYSPKEVNLYAVDCNSWGLIAFQDMPHMGGVALSGQDEKIQKLFRMINEEIATRKRLFMKYAVTSLEAYRMTVMGSGLDTPDMPAIVIAVDNLTMLLNQYPDLEENFIDLAAAGAAYGVYLIFTANNASGVKFKIAPNIKNAITFELADKGEYKQLLKGTMVRNNLTGNRGRACHSGQQPVEFQTALCSAGENDIIRNDNLKKTVAQLKQKWSGYRAKAIPVLPERVDVHLMSACYTEREILPVGYDCETVEPFCIDLRESYCMLVTGMMKSGKSRQMINLVRLVRSRQEEQQIYIIDGSNGDLRELKSAAAGYAACNDAPTLTPMLKQILTELSARKKQQRQALEADPDLDKAAFGRRFPLLCVVIDDLREILELVSDDDQLQIERICKLAQHLGVLVFVAARSTDIAKYCQNESLTIGLVSNQKGLAVNGTPMQHSYFVNSLDYNKKNAEPGDGNAFTFDNGTCAKIKRME